MSLSILIGGQDYTAYTDISTLKVSSNIAVSSDTATLDIIIPQRVIARPKGGQEIKIINGANIEFGGVIINPQEFALATDQMKNTLNCKNYQFWFDKRLVTFNYSGNGQEIRTEINRYRKDGNKRYY